MASEERVDRQVQLLRESIGSLAGAFEAAFGPDGCVPEPSPRPGPPRGTAGDEPMYSIGKKIDDVLESYGLLQEALGLEPGDGPKYARMLAPPSPSPVHLPDSPN